jgi:hypothetical protein
VVIPQACADHGHSVIKSTELIAQHLVHRSLALYAYGGVLHHDVLRADVAVAGSVFGVKRALLGRLMRDE